MYCLDTNIIIDLFKGDTRVKEHIAGLGADIATTPISLAELFKGAFLSHSAEQRIRQVYELSRRIEVLQFSVAAASIFGQLFAHLKKKGQQAPELDLLIASIALAHEATLITRDKTGFAHIPGLKVVVI